MPQEISTTIHKNINSQQTRIAVIGGGISGLSAALKLREIDPLCEVTLFEASHRLGGVIQTEYEQDFMMESGPDNFITTIPWAMELCRRIGFEDQLLQTDESRRRAFVVHRNRLKPIPDGFLIMAPVESGQCFRHQFSAFLEKFGWRRSISSHAEKVWKMKAWQHSPCVVLGVKLMSD